MTLVADFYLETPVLRSALAAVPEMTAAVEQQTLRDSKPFVLSFWASGGDFDAFDAALADDPTVADATVLGEFDGRRLYQAELTDEAARRMTYHAWADLGGVFVSSEWVGDRWRTRIRFPDRDALREYVEFCDRRELTFDLHQLYEATDRDDDSFGLTDPQREALRTATGMGFFEVPRAVELEDVADVLGVSRQAVSERLRRGTETLVRSTILRESVADGEDEADES